MAKINYKVFIAIMISLFYASTCFADYEIGLGKAEMDLFLKGAGLNGYGEFCNRVFDQRSKLYSRSLLIKSIDSDSMVLFINCELGNISHSIKSTLFDTLSIMGYNELSERNTMITATHTHSAPGGYHHYAFYNFSHPGFQEDILREIVKGIVKSIQTAFSNLRPAEIYFNEGHFKVENSVAYNRSIKAFNRNFPKSERVNRKKTALALDSTMYVLKFIDKEGRSFGLLNWFGVHATGIGNGESINFIRQQRVCGELF